MIELTPMIEADLEWVRLQRNRPEQFKYFRQDEPISAQRQKKWWRELDKSRVRLYLVEDDGRRVGYVGFNPYDGAARKAEFGIFIVNEEQGKGYGPAALKALLRKGFVELGLELIYSDVLMYPGEEGRWNFYRSAGFVKDPEKEQTAGYTKKGVYIPSLKFHITRARYFELYGPDGTGSPSGLKTLL